MGPIEKRIALALASNNFILSLHAKDDRMLLRNVRRSDIVECGRTAKNCVYDQKRGTYKVRGCDLEGDELTVIVGLDNGVVVVTVY